MRFTQFRAYSQLSKPPVGSKWVGISAAALTTGVFIGYALQPKIAAAAAPNTGSAPSTNSASAENASTLPLKDTPALKYASRPLVAEAIEKIKAVVGEENVTTNKDVIMEHADSDWQFYHAKPGEHSNAVVYPGNTQEVSNVMKIAHEYKIPVTAYSGGTSLEGQFTPVKQGISLDLNRMNQVLAIHKTDMDAVVQPAVSWQGLNDELNPKGLLFGVDPGPGAALGGMVNTCASGTRAYRYGTMRQNLVGVEAVLADGTIIRTRRRPRKSSAGYSLGDLIAGSEGTLAIVTEVTVKCHALPKFLKVGTISFPTLRDATSTVVDILQSGYHLDAMELMDPTQMKLVNKSGITDRKWEEADTLLVKFAGPTEDAVDRDIKEVEKISKRHNASLFTFAKDEDEADDLWAARRNALYSVLYSCPEGYKAFGTDTAVPISQLSQFVEDAQRKLKESNLLGSVLGHVGDGNFHLCIGYDPKTELDKVEELAHWLAHRSVELDGTCTGEHGIGMGKRDLLVDELGEPAIDTMRQIKRALDPNFILNPGKVFQLEEEETTNK